MDDLNIKRIDKALKLLSCLEYQCPSVFGYKIPGARPKEIFTTKDLFKREYKILGYLDHRILIPRHTISYFVPCVIMETYVKGVGVFKSKGIVRYNNETNDVIISNTTVDFGIFNIKDEHDKYLSIRDNPLIVDRIVFKDRKSDGVLWEDNTLRKYVYYKHKSDGEFIDELYEATSTLENKYILTFREKKRKELNCLS